MFKPDRSQEVFGQPSQGHGVTPGVPCAGPGIELDDSCGSLPAQDIL